MYSSRDQHRTNILNAIRDPLSRNFGSKILRFIPTRPWAPGINWTDQGVAGDNVTIVFRCYATSDADAFNEIIDAQLPQAREYFQFHIDRFYLNPKLFAKNTKMTCFSENPSEELRSVDYNLIKLSTVQLDTQQHLKNEYQLEVYFSTLYLDLPKRISLNTFKIIHPPHNNNTKNRGERLLAGSGFLIDNPQHGLQLLTAKHVMDSSDRCLILNENGQEFKITSSKQLNNLDICILQSPDFLNAIDFTAPRLNIGRVDRIEFSDKVFVSGFPNTKKEDKNPTSVKQTITTGHVSGISTTFAGQEDLIQISSAAINPNISGGPVLDAVGNVIGVLVSRGKYSEDNMQNIAHANKIDFEALNI